VNYYFSSKENLFLEVLRSGYLSVANTMKEIVDKNKGEIESIMVDVLHHFLENSCILMSHFKMMMSAQHSHLLTSDGSEDRMYGPPGGMIISEVLKKYVPDASAEDLHWALKTLFSHVTHLSLIFTCCFKTNHDIPFSSKDDLEKSVRRLTGLVLSELKQPRHKS
jgi:AcrR family transcriptional regulator